MCVSRANLGAGAEFAGILPPCILAHLESGYVPFLCNRAFQAAAVGVECGVHTGQRLSGALEL
eukprot:2935157-Prymnesium_polylepis.1